MSQRAPRALRQKVMVPLLAIGILSAVAIGAMAYLSIEAQLMRQLRYRAVQIIDTVSVGSEGLDEIKELQHSVLAMSVSPDTSLILVVDQNQRIIAASRSNLIDRQVSADPKLHSAADIAWVITTKQRSSSTSTAPTSTSLRRSQSTAPSSAPLASSTVRFSSVWTCAPFGRI